MVLRYDGIALDVMSEQRIEKFSEERGQFAIKYAIVTMSDDIAEATVNQRKIIRLLSEAPGLEQLHITGDRQGNCLPAKLPVVLPKLKTLTLAAYGGDDPLISNIKPQLMSSWIESCPALEEFYIDYGLHDTQGQWRTDAFLASLELMTEKIRARTTPTPFIMSFNWRIQVGASQFLQKFNKLGISLRNLRLRVDNSCGCSDKDEELFLTELGRLMEAQSHCLETLKLHCSIEVTHKFKFPKMKKLETFFVLPFSFRQLQKELPIFQPFQSGQFPSLESLKLTNYYERHGMFAEAGVFETVKSLTLERTPQEVFIEKWDQIFPNLKHIHLLPASASQLKVVLTKMVHLEEIIIKALDMNETELKKLMPEFQNLKELKSLFFEMFPDETWVFMLVAKATEAQQFPRLEKLSFRMRSEPDAAQRQILEAYHKEVVVEVTKAKCTHEGCECGE